MTAIATFRRIIAVILLMGITIFSYASSSDDKEFWTKQSEELGDRYLLASDEFHEDWVLDFADSLETLGRSDGQFRYYAAELRCHNAFNKKDSLLFFTYNEEARRLALKYDLADNYFSEIMNAVSFYINLGEYGNALLSAKELLDEAQNLNNIRGQFYGFYVLGILYSDRGNTIKGIENYNKALDCLEKYEDENKDYHRAMVLSSLSKAYYKREEFQSSLDYAQKSIESSPWADDAEAYVALSNYKLGNYKAFLNAAGFYVKKANDNSISYDFFKNAISALCHATNGSRELALFTVDKLDESEEKYDFLADIYKIFGEWEKAYECKGNAAHLRRIRNDELFEEDMAMMETQIAGYESHRKKVQARILLTSTVIIFLLLLAFIITYYFYSKRIIKLKDHEIEVSKSYRTLIDNAPVYVSRGRLIYGKNGKVKDYMPVSANKFLLDMDPEILTKTALESYPISGRLAIRKINEALDNKLPFIQFSYDFNEFGRAYEVAMLFDIPGYVRVINLDTTALLKANKELAEAKEKAERSDRVKTQFVQNMSHEIRTPLNAIMGFSQLLGLPKDSITDEEREQYLSYIKNNSDMLMMLIDDILDASDAENGNYRINISDAYCNEICRNAVQTVEYRTPEGVKMYFTTELEDSFCIKSDVRRIQQVLINYLTNACKHTTEGSIHVHCSNTENPGHVTFSVTDTGCGVPEEMADNIFERFTKLDAFKQGAGLGLNICSTIAQKLNATVKLDTSYKSGARFLLII